MMIGVGWGLEARADKSDWSKYMETPGSKVPAPPVAKSTPAPPVKQAAKQAPKKQSSVARAKPAPKVKAKAKPKR